MATQSQLGLRSQWRSGVDRPHFNRPAPDGTNLALMSKDTLMNTVENIIHTFLLTAALASGMVLAGCDRKETVVDIDTPHGGVEVERNLDNGAVTVDVGKDSL